MLEVKDLHVSYGKVHAVNGVSAGVRSGSVTLVLGANGAGKTSSLRAVCGLQKASAGSVLLEGEEVLGTPAHRIVRRGLVMVPEGRRIFAPLSVEENLRIGGYVADRDRTAETAERVYAMFPVLADRRKGAAGLLSGGEQQMLAFGRAMMSQPKVMLLDEPSMGLAPVIVEQVMASVRTIADSGIAVLMVEQNADAGLAVADQVVVMARGEVAYSGSAAEARSHESVVLAFLGEAALTS